MKLKNRLMSIAGLLGMLTVLLLGAAGTAQATDNPDYTCGNVVLVQVCDNDVDVPVDIDVDITSARLLTGNEIEILETTLKAVTDVDVTKNDIKVAVVKPLHRRLQHHHPIRQRRRHRRHSMRMLIS